MIMFESLVCKAMGKCPAQSMSHCYGISFIEYVFECHYLSYHYGLIRPYFVILRPQTLIIKYASNYNDNNNDDDDDDVDDHDDNDNDDDDDNNNNNDNYYNHDNNDTDNDNNEMIMIKTTQTPCPSLCKDGRIYNKTA